MQIIPQTDRLQKQIKIPITLSFKPFNPNYVVQHFNKKPSRCARCQAYINCYTQLEGNKYNCIFCGKQNYLEDLAPEMNVKWQSNITEYDVDDEQYNPASQIQLTGDAQSPSNVGIVEDETLQQQQEFRSTGIQQFNNYRVYLVQLCDNLFKNQNLEQILYFQLFNSQNTVVLFIGQKTQILIDNYNEIHEIAFDCPIDEPFQYFISNNIPKDEKNQIFQERVQIMNFYYKSDKIVSPDSNMIITSILNVMNSLSTCGGQINLILLENFLNQHELLEQKINENLKFTFNEKLRISMNPSINKNIQTNIYVTDENIQFQNLIFLPIFSQGKCFKTQNLCEDLTFQYREVVGFQASQYLRTSQFLEVQDEGLNSIFNLGCLSFNTVSDWDLQVEESIYEVNYVQYAILYTNLEMKRKIRVISVPIKAANKMTLVYNSLNQYQLIITQIRKLIKDSFSSYIPNTIQSATKQINKIIFTSGQKDSQKADKNQNQKKKDENLQFNYDISHVYDNLVEQIIGYIVQFRNNSNGPQNSMTLPLSLQLVPLLLHCTQRSLAFSENLQKNEGGKINSIQKCNALCSLLTFSGLEFAREVYPGCYKLNDIFNASDTLLIPAPYPLNSMYLSEMSTNCYWFINSSQSILMVGRIAQQQVYQLFEALNQQIPEQYKQNEKLFVTYPLTLHIQWNQNLLQTNIGKIIFTILKLYQNSSNSIQIGFLESEPYNRVHQMLVEDANSKYSSYYDTLQYIQRQVQLRKK